jgi:hypothetical protein
MANNNKNKIHNEKNVCLCVCAAHPEKGTKSFNPNIRRYKIFSKDNVFYLSHTYNPRKVHHINNNSDNNNNGEHKQMTRFSVGFLFFSASVFCVAHIRSWFIRFSFWNNLCNCVGKIGKTKVYLESRISRFWKPY